MSLIIIYIYRERKYFAFYSQNENDKDEIQFRINAWIKNRRLVEAKQIFAFLSLWKDGCISRWRLKKNHFWLQNPLGLISFLEDVDFKSWQITI